MVLNLVEPQSSGIGGGAFILYWDKQKNELASIDGRETAPSAATPELFLDTDGKPLARDAAMASGLSVGVPGVLAALKLAHDKYGKLPWADLFEPAIALARGGFAVSPRLAAVLAEAPAESFTPEARAYFFDAEGKPWPVGHILANPALADTLATIARDGPDAFYKGDIAADIAHAVQNDPRRPGTLSVEDIANYRAKERDARLRRLSRREDLRGGSSLLRRGRGRAGADADRPLRSRARAARRARRPHHHRGRAARSMPTAPAISPTPISSPLPSPGCSIRLISPSAAA